MTAPIKFDFSSYTAAISAIPAIREQETGPRIAESHESQDSTVKNAELTGETTTTQNRRIAEIAKGYDDFSDDRRHCRECLNIRNGYCTRQRFRPVDDIPRRCEDFNDYQDQTGSSASGTAAPDPLQVTVYTPSGAPMTTAETISETEHNAKGQYFKFLATWPDGSQCYLCQMPRQTIDEMLTQYPTATKIEPILNEEYPHD